MFPGRGDRRVQVLGDDAHRIISGEGWIPGRELVQHHTQRVQVHPVIDLLAGCLLRGQVQHGTDERSLGREARCNRVGQPKVHDLGRAVGEAHHILRLEIAMDDAVAVGVLQGSTDLAGIGDDLADFCRGLVVQGVTLDQFHHDEGRTIRLSSIVHSDDVGLVELGRGSCLVQQARPALGVQASLVQNLDGDVALKQDVVGAIDDAHATPAQFGVEPVALIE